MSLEQSLPDPESMSPQERLQATNAYRTRAARGEKLPKHEIHHAMRLLASMRQTAVENSGTKKKSAKAAEEAKAASKVDSLLGDI